MSISIIIPTMNRPSTLKSTLESIKESNYLPKEVIIIDQSIKEIDRNTIKEYVESDFKNLNIKYIYLNKPSSTKARNIGIKNCKNEIIVFMDDDVKMETDILSNISEIMNDSKISMIAGLDDLTTDGKSVLGYIFAKKSIINYKKGHVTKAMFGRYPKRSNDIIDTQWAMGYFFVVRKSIINKYNLEFDEKLISYAYPEDLDFTYSYYNVSKKQGLKCIIHPKVHVKHLCSNEYRVTSFKTTCMYVINREYLSYKYFKTPMSRILTRWANIGELIRRTLKNDKPLDVLKAQYYCDKYRRDIKNGILHYEIYDK